MDKQLTRSIFFNPDELTVHSLNDSGLPGDLLNSKSVSLTTKSYTGYAKMTVSEDSDSATQQPEVNNNLFYWFFESRNASLANDPDNIPVVIWLNGGPGSSSLIGLLMENGPLKLVDDDTATIIENLYSWNKECHLLYWDQPVGTGFSYTTDEAGYMNNESELSREFCTALEMFFAKDEFSAYRKCPLYIAGESYAGKYIPNIVCELMANRETNYASVPELTGVAIGDGWMMPGLQAKCQVEFGYEMGFVDVRQFNILLEKCKVLQSLINDGKDDLATETGSIILNQLLSCGGNPNIYDVRSYSDLSLARLNAYLNNEQVRQALAVESVWQTADNSGLVGQYLYDDVYASDETAVTQLLTYAKEGKLKILFYTGNFDMSCGFSGTEEMLWEYNYPNIEKADFSKLRFRAEEKPTTDSECWQNVERMVWVMPPDKTLGFVKSFGNLTQVVIVNSGHLVPMNRPKVSRSMMSHWIFNTPFPSIKPAIG
jgi:vitellogenic carboxypeptidase-like protein